MSGYRLHLPRFVMRDGRASILEIACGPRRLVMSRHKPWRVCLMPPRGVWFASLYVDACDFEIESSPRRWYRATISRDHARALILAVREWGQAPDAVLTGGSGEAFDDQLAAWANKQTDRFRIEDLMDQLEGTVANMQSTGVAA